MAQWVVDDEPSRRYPLYTRGNVGEVFPDVVSPLTWSLYGREAEMGWREAFYDFGVSVPGDFGDEPMVILGVFGGYCYINASYVRVFAVRTPGMSVEDIDRQFFGESDAPPYRSEPGHKNRKASLRALATIVRTLRARDLPHLEADRRRVDAFLRALPDPATADDDELVADLIAFRPIFRHLFRHHILTSFQANVGVSALGRLLTDVDHFSPMALVAGLGHIDSAAPSFALWDLSRLVAADARLGEEFDSGADGLLGRLQGYSGATPFLDAFHNFVEEFGSRGPNEWEGSSPTWGTRPELALAAIDRLRLQPGERAPRLQQEMLERRRREMTEALRARLSRAQRFQFGPALRAAHLFSRGRERSKTTVIRAIHGIRLLQLELARRVRDRGGPEDPADLWLATVDELAAYVADPRAHLAEMAERAETRDRLASLVPPFIFEGRQPPPELWEPRHALQAPVALGTRLVGIPGCPGTARGRARVVTDPMDPRGLAPGEVLVAPITDPSWTPLFLAAEAVVVDVGAQMSHAVIVCRELGIPAVVSVTGASRTIPDGALLEVDGDRGVVTVLHND